MCKLQTNRHISEINRGKSSSGSKLITNLTMPHVSTSPAPAIHQQHLVTLHFLSENSCHSQNKCLWNKTIYFMMKKKVFKIIIKHSRTSMQDRPAQKVGQEIKNSLPSIAKRHDCEETLFSGRWAHNLGPLQFGGPELPAIRRGCLVTVTLVHLGGPAEARIFQVNLPAPFFNLF